MSIGPNELIRLLEQTRARVAPAEAASVQIAIDTIRHTGLRAESGSDSSRRIQKILKAHRELLEPAAAARLERVQIFGVDIHICDALPRIDAGQDQVVVFDGLLYLIRFHVDMINAMVLLQSQRADAHVTVDGEEMPLWLALSLAGHALIVDAIQSGRPLAGLGDLMGPVAQRRAEIGYAGAVLFLLLHELGHIDCGHLTHGSRSERSEGMLRVPEALTAHQQNELEADAFAMRCLRGEIRSEFVSSVMFCLAPFAFAQTFATLDAPTHPLAVNRLARIADHLALTGDAEFDNAVCSIVTGEVERFTRLAPQRAEAGGDMRFRLREHMPLQRAYETLSIVRSAVLADGHPPDFAA